MAHPVLQSLQGRLVPATNNPVPIGHAYIVIKLGVNKCKKIQGGFSCWLISSDINNLTKSRRIMI
jgi:hypothetical protein